MDLLIQFDRNVEMSLKERIATEMFNERSSLTEGSSVPVGTTLLDDQASPNTTAAFMISFLPFLKFNYYIK